MREVMHVVSRVLMRAWYRRVIAALASAPRARGVPQAHARGLDPDRILVFGNGLASGWGVATHELALPGELARSLSSITGRGVDVDVSVSVDLKIAGAEKFLKNRDFSSYDAIVVIIGSSDALSLTPRAQWRASMLALIEVFLARVSTSARIFVVEQVPFRLIPPLDNRFGRIANSHATTLNDVTRELCNAYSRVDYVALSPSTAPATERLATPERYKAWGRTLARELAPLLNAEALSPSYDTGSSARSDRHRPQANEDRYNTLDRLGIIDSGPDEYIDRIVATARSVFGTEGAAFTLIGRDRQWHKSIVGADITDVPLEFSLCTVTIRELAPLIVADVREDPRFTPQSAIAFYAGYPIESPDGQRIGALCVFDVNPRNPSMVDPTILRDIALLVQEQVWRYPLVSNGRSNSHGLTP